MMTAGERIPALDAVRGIALFGILVVNAPFFFMPYGALGDYGSIAFSGWHNRFAEFITTWLFDGKFILIFSFLFGWGLHTQMGRGDGFKAPYMRRLSGLFLIGLIHAIFLFVGDILVTYAVLGLPLYYMRNWSVPKLCKAAALFWLLSIFTQGLLGFLFANAAPIELARYASLVALHQHGTFQNIFTQRIEDLMGLYIITPLLFMPEVMGMFLLGLAAAKTFASTGLDRTLPLAKTLLRFLWVPAFIGNGVYAYAASPLYSTLVQPTLELALRGAVVPLLTLVYLCAAALLFNDPARARIAALLGGEGRMSLSIYVGESAIMGLLALSYGFGLFGTISPSLLFALCIAVYAALLLVSHLWLRTFRLGPMEWVLRSITYWRFERLVRSYNQHLTGPPAQSDR